MFIKLSYPVWEHNFDEYVKRDSVNFVLDKLKNNIHKKEYLSKKKCLWSLGF